MLGKKRDQEKLAENLLMPTKRLSWCDHLSTCSQGNKYSREAKQEIHTQ